MTSLQQPRDIKSANLVKCAESKCNSKAISGSTRCTAHRGTTPAQHTASMTNPPRTTDNSKQAAAAAKKAEAAAKRAAAAKK